MTALYCDCSDVSVCCCDRWSTDDVIKFLRSKGWNITELENVPDVDEIDGGAVTAAASKQQQQQPSQHIVFETSSSENTRDVDTPPLPALPASGPSQHFTFDTSEDETGVDTTAAGMYERVV